MLSLSTRQTQTQVCSSYWFIFCRYLERIKKKNRAMQITGLSLRDKLNKTTESAAYEI